MYKVIIILDHFNLRDTLEILRFKLLSIERKFKYQSFKRKFIVLKNDVKKKI